MKKELEKEYHLRFSKIQEYRYSIWIILTNNFFQSFIPTESIILDLGCGWGEFINNIKGQSKFGMDFNPNGKQHLDSSIEFINQDCSEKWLLPDDSLDIVFTSNFFEHLPTKNHLTKTLIQAKRCLKPNAKIICMGPNIKYISGAYWDFWDHHIALSESSLSEVLKMYEFSIEKCWPRFLPYTMGNKQPPPSFLKIYLYFPIAWRFLGKQFLIIANNIK